MIALVVLVRLIRIGYAHQWTGFGQAEAKAEVQPAKTLWDWLDLLIVPVVLAIGGYLFNSSQNRATQAAAKQRVQDEALQAYLDHMSDLLIPDKERPSLHNGENDDITSVARARTLTVLASLDGDHKGSVVQFLYESSLIRRDVRGPNIDGGVISLQKADLRGADLRDANLQRADLRGADLRGANMGYRVSWNSISLFEGPTNLMKADLFEAQLVKADLRAALLCEANLGGADLKGADLKGADLQEANLHGANLQKANLSTADLTGAVTRSSMERPAQLMTNEALDQSGALLADATMPNGQKYEDWLKDKQGPGKDGKTNASS